MQPWDSRRYWELCHPCLWLCPCYLERTFCSGAVSPASGPCFLPTAASHVSRCGWCECHIAEMLQAARVLGREKRSSWVCCCACRLTVCKASLEGGIRMSAYQLLRTLKMDSSRKKLLLIFLNIFINHLLSGKTKPAEFRCQCQVLGIHARHTNWCNP